MNYLKILAVDDDTNVTAYIKTELESEGWEVVTANSGENAVDITEKSKPDLVVLDLRMPNLDGSDGIAVCRKLREKGNHTPIIITSGLIETDDKIKLLNIGADDYLTKPFVIGELVARIKAVLRRSHTSYCLPSHSFTSRDISIDFDRHKIICRNQEVRLSPIEYELFEELVRNVGAILSYSHLLEKLWGYKDIENVKYLYIFISRLRMKLELDPANPKYIINVPTLGYLFSIE